MTEMLVYVLVLNAISGAASMTMVGKRPAGSVRRLKVTAPDVYVNVPPLPHQRATTPSAALQDRLHILRVPNHRQKHRYYVKKVRPLVYPVVVAQRQRPSLPPPPQRAPLRPTTSAEESEGMKDNDHESSFPLENGESFPSFGRDSPFLQELRKPTPAIAPDQSSEQHDQAPEFTPVQTYLQVRQTNQVKHVPQSEAVKDATTLEEVVNAPRLKEVLRTTRVREVYTEEGYEDAGYDHGGHIREAEHDEGYSAKDKGIFKLKGKVEEEDYTLPEETKKKKKTKKKMTHEEVPQESKVEPKISRSEVANVEYATLPAKYKGGHKYSSKIRRPEMTTESFWAVPTVFEATPTSTSPMGYDVITFPTETIGATPRSKYIKIITTSEEPGRIQKTNTTGKEMKKRNKGFKYSRLHAKYPKRDRFRLAKLASSTDRSVENDDGRIILPTIGYINSLTTAHFAKDMSPQVGNNNLLTTPLNLTQALSYMRANKQKRERRKLVDVSSEMFFEPLRVKTRGKREAEAYDEEIPDDGEEEHDLEIKETEDEQRLRPESEEEQYEKELREELDRQKEEIIGATLGRYGPKVAPEESREIPKSENTEKDGKYMVTTTTTKPVDPSKYPFYFSREVNQDSPLRYATNPKDFPKKIGSGMVFYESREKLRQCPEVRPDLDDIPRRNSSPETEGDRKRLVGLGDKILCLRSKYFDEDPLDNPLFKETEIDYVGRIKKPEESVKDGRKADQTPRNLRFHSNYQYRPNGTLRIMVQGSEKPDTTERIIPVTENVDESPPQEFTRISGLTPPPPVRRNHIRPTRSKVVVPHSCLHVIGKMAGLNSHKNLIIDCNDAMLIQEKRNDVRYLKIIPKIMPRRRETSSDWVPMMSYPTRFGRRKDSKDEDLYLITELKEEEGVRRGEVVEDVPKRRKRAAEETEKNLPLKLSLKEFFLLLQNNNQKNPFAPKPFQLPTSMAVPKPFQSPKKSLPKLFQIATAAPKPEESQEDEIVRIGGQYIKGTDGRELVYINFGGVGRWVVSQPRPKHARKYKKYKGKF